MDGSGPARKKVEPGGGQAVGGGLGEEGIPEGMIWKDGRVHRKQGVEVDTELHSQR